MNSLLDRVWEASCGSVSAKLVLVYLVWAAGLSRRVRVEPAEVTRHTGVPVRRVEEVLAGLNAAGFIDATRWNDTGAWSVRITL